MHQDLTDHARQQIDRARQAGRDLTAPVGVTHFFSSPGREPKDAVAALHASGIEKVVADEELTRDGYWHVAAFTALPLTAPAIQAVERQMEEIAAATNCQYDGWRITLTAGEEATLRRAGHSP